MYKCIIKRVIDGDTIDIDIDLGFDVWLKNQRIRLCGINTPEIRTRDTEEKEMGIESKKFVEEHFPEGSERIFISSVFERGKFGRILGDFYMPSDQYGSHTLCSILLEKKLAEPYK